jgi:hypothetical protein
MTEITGSFTESRGLTTDEVRVLRWLLTVGAAITGTDAEQAAAYLPQIDELRVSGRCDCGCPSIDLALVESTQMPVDDASYTLADVDGRSPEGTAIGLILRAKSGCLSELEAYAHDCITPFSLPTDQQLADFG